MTIIIILAIVIFIIMLATKSQKDNLTHQPGNLSKPNDLSRNSKSSNGSISSGNPPLNKAATQKEEHPLITYPDSRGHISGRRYLLPPQKRENNLWQLLPDYELAVHIAGLRDSDVAELEACLKQTGFHFNSNGIVGAFFRRKGLRSPQVDEFIKSYFAKKGKSMDAEEVFEKIGWHPGGDTIVDFFEDMDENILSIIEEHFDRISEKNENELIENQIQNYFEAVGYIIGNTHASAYYSRRFVILSTEERAYEKKEGIVSDFYASIQTDGCCEKCVNQYSEKTYSRMPKKIPPYHVGCVSRLEN